MATNNADEGDMGDQAEDQPAGGAENGTDEVDAAGAAAGTDGPTSITGIGPPSPLTGCYLLIIIGEPHSDEHKDIILQRLIKGEWHVLILWTILGLFNRFI